MKEIQELFLLYRCHLRCTAKTKSMHLIVLYRVGLLKTCYLITPFVAMIHRWLHKMKTNHYAVEQLNR